MNELIAEFCPVDFRICRLVGVEIAGSTAEFSAERDGFQ